MKRFINENKSDDREERNILFKFVTALISTVACSLVFFRPKSISLILENSIFLNIILIMFLGYLFLGIPFSYLIDIANHKIEIQDRISRYFINVVLYGLAGILAFYMLFVFMEGELFTREFSVLLGGFIPSLIFYHVLLMLKGLHIIFRGKEGS